MAHVQQILGHVYRRSGNHYMGKPLHVVVLTHGTVLLCPTNDNFDPAKTMQSAIACLEAAGPVVYGCESADFEPIRLDSHAPLLQGRVCVVFELPECEACERFEMYGIPAEVCGEDERSLLQMGMLQRARRQEDYEKMEVELVYRID